jgi:acetylornithine deacetylase/succinyl-diaminopimelate desuccinylase-like protein
VDLDLEVLGSEEPGPDQPDLALFETLAEILRDHDAEARPIPLLLPAVTDGRHFARLGIQTYGFLPMQLPEDLRFMELIHAEDERIPAAAVEFGARAIGDLLERYGR